VHLGTNRLAIVRCGLLDRETVELNTKHRTLALFHLRPSSTLIAHFKKHCCSCPLLYVFQQFLFTSSPSASQNQSILPALVCALLTNTLLPYHQSTASIVSVPRPSRPLTASTLLLLQLNLGLCYAIPRNIPKAPA
jgi:hypothetical protein